MKPLQEIIEFKNKTHKKFNEFSDYLSSKKLIKFRGIIQSSEGIYLSAFMEDAPSIKDTQDYPNLHFIQMKKCWEVKVNL